MSMIDEGKYLTFKALGRVFSQAISCSVSGTSYRIDGICCNIGAQNLVTVAVSLVAAKRAY